MMMNVNKENKLIEIVPIFVNKSLFKPVYLFLEGRTVRLDDINYGYLLAITTFCEQ